jgi:2-polyprenyl-6-methoxyphenol hydroxylase-like FAD-dependent oxidoreductase
MTTVLIVGSGPTGLTLACDLARRGIDIRVLEKTPQFPRSSRAKGPNPRSLEVLEDLGVLDRVLAAGTAPLVMRKYRDGVAIADTDPSAGPAPTPGAPYAQGWLLAQWQLEAILRDRLAGYGVRVELGAEVVAVAQDDDGVTVRLADGRTVAAAYLVGCDGGHSTVRRQVGLSLVGHSDPEQVMVVGDVEADGLDRAVWHQWFNADGGVMMCPIPGTERSWWFQAGPEIDADGRPVEPSAASFQRLFDRHARVPGVVLREAAQLSTYRVNVRMVDRYRVGRVLLAGDAAHVHPIAGGLGMQTGIQDAVNLGWKLAMVAADQAVPELLDTYQEERLPVAEWTLGFTSERLAAVMAAISEPGAGLEVVMTAGTTNLDQGYRWSSLAGPGGTAALRPGDRAPDAPCRADDGATVRLFEVFAGPHFTLLGFGKGALDSWRTVGAGYADTVRTCAVDAGPEGLADPDGHARAGYGITGEALVLVRPDNHVALIGDAQEVLAYLQALRRTGKGAGPGGRG